MMVLWNCWVAVLGLFLIVCCEAFIIHLKWWKNLFGCWFGLIAATVVVWNWDTAVSLGKFLGR